MKRNLWKIAAVFLIVIVLARTFGLSWSVLGQSLGLKKEVSVLPGNKKFFGTGEKVKIKLDNPDSRNLKAKVVDENKVEVSAEIMEKSESGISQFEVTPPPQFKPGKYILEITDEAGNVIMQDFSWGVLAINFNRAIYTPGEKASIAMAVLDEKGAMVCGAKLILTITSPSGQKSELSTDNGRIIVNPECQSKEYTQKPDYEAQYEVTESGDYTIELKAETGNGEYSISDAFKAEGEPKFKVERTSATRIFPVQSYEMKIKIVANEDFKGKIYEPVPSSFDISQMSGVVEYKTINKEDKNNKIEWQVKIKKGEEISLGYQYKAPEISPQFYLTGPLTMMTLTDLAYSEGRQWQIAADEIQVAKIRQEINIIDGLVTTGGTDAAIVNLDTSKYNGATYYFEIIANKGAGTTLTVNLSTGDTNTVGIGISNTTNVLVRKQFTPETGSFDYRLNLTTGTTPTVKAARIIILQSATSITNTQTQIEIGNLEVGLSSATTTPLTSPKYWKYDSTVWDAGTTFYAELTYKQSSNLSGGSTSFAVAGTFNVGSTNFQRNITAEAWGAGGGGGNRTSSGAAGGGGGGAFAVKNAYSLAAGVGMTAVVGVGRSMTNGGASYVSAAGSTFVSAAGGIGVTTANILVGGRGGLAANSIGDTKYNGGVGASGVTGSYGGGGGGGAGDLNIGANGSTSNGGLGGAGIGTSGGTGGNGATTNGNGNAGSSPGGGGGGSRGNNATVRRGGDGAAGRVEISWPDKTYNTNFYLQQDDGNFGGWTNFATIGTGLTGTVPSRLRSGSFTPVSGRHYRIVGNINDATGTFDIYNAKIVADQTNSSGINKFEAQYLLLNTKSTTTGSALGYQTLWDSAEWTRTTNVYKHAQDAIGVTANTKLRDITAGADVTNSSVTGNNQTISGNLTMPTSGNLIDSWIVAAGTEVDASRILTQVTINAPPADNSPTVVLNTAEATAFTTKNPSLEFTGTDIESDRIEYNIQIGTTDSFTSPLLSKFSVSDVGFTNTVNAGDTHPFISGNKIQYTVQIGDSLAVGTYYWRVSGKDPAGTNTYGAWSGVRSFTVQATTSFDQVGFRWSNDDGGEAHGAGGGGGWYNYNWNYRAPVVIANSLGTTLTDFQVRINVGTSALIAANKLQSDCSDLRFVDSDDSTPISYWIEYGCDTSSTAVWVKIPTIAASVGSTIMMYYGNSAAVAGQDGDSTFDLFDDFLGSSLDTNKWHEWNPNSWGSLSVGSGILTLNGVSTGGVEYVMGILSNNPFTFSDHIIEIYNKWSMSGLSTNGYLQSKGVRISDVSSPTSTMGNNQYWWQYLYYNGMFNIKTRTYTFTKFMSGATSEPTKTSVSNDRPANFEWERYIWRSGPNENSYRSTNGSTYSSLWNATDNLYGFPASEYVGFTIQSKEGSGDSFTAYLDWIRIRKYASTEPTSTIEAESGQPSNFATWMAAENVGVTGVIKNTNIRLRFLVDNTGDSGDLNLRLQIAPLGGAGSCEAVSSGNFVDVPTTLGVGTSVAVMTTSANFTDQDATTSQLTASGTTFVAGKMVEYSSNQTNSITLGTNTHTEAEYNFQFTPTAAYATSYCFRTRNATTDLTTYSHVAMATLGEEITKPILEQIMRHGTWFLNGIKQFFTF